MIGLETDRSVLHAFETAKKQAGADEKKHRERNFGGNEDAPEALLRGAGRRTARAFVESFAEVEFRGAESGCNAEDEAGDDGDDDREEEDGAIELDGENLRDRTCGNS